jgi:hypothetical protein
MKRMLLSAIMVFISVALLSCGGGGGSDTFVTQILSDPAFDGDIALTTSNNFTITQSNTETVFAGINPTTGTEYRAFLDFPLTGVDGVPGNAIIVSAFVEIYIDSILLQAPGDTIPIRIDLVDIQPPYPLLDSDFYRSGSISTAPALATTTIIPPISLSDNGQYVSVDVTSLMVEAQNLGLPDFQVRILEDDSVLDVPHGRIELDDTTGPNRDVYAPLLEVTYY